MMPLDSASTKFGKSLCRKIGTSFVARKASIATSQVKGTVGTLYYDPWSSVFHNPQQIFEFNGTGRLLKTSESRNEAFSLIDM